jgi:hypothetical protein
MIPAGMTQRTRAQTALASQAARHSRWPAGTLAAAGTIPARTMNAHATLVIGQGHHPANHRSAIPTRVYESGSGHGHDAAPAGHPHPPRPPPDPATRNWARVPWPPIIGSRQPASRPPGASPCERSAHLDPGHRSHDHGSYQDTGSDSHAQRSPHRARHNPQTSKNQAQDLQNLDVPLHMSAQPRPSRTTVTQVSGPPNRSEPKCGPARVSRGGPRIRSRRRTGFAVGGGESEPRLPYYIPPGQTVNGGCRTRLGRR